ncbi:MAG TPA: polysaccharide biosynthesis/export family protein [Rhizomicrobium sp.]
MQIFLRLSLLAGALALLIFSLRAATAQEPSQHASPPPGAQSDPYGLVPVQNAQPDNVPYGIKPIPGYTPPAAVAPPPSASPPPDVLRGSVSDMPAIPAHQPPSNYSQDNFGTVPLREPMPISAPRSGAPDNYGAVPLRPAQAEPQQPPLRASTASDDQGEMPYAMPPQPIAYQVDANQGSAYRLGPGDKIRLTVFGETDLSGEYQVDGSGMVRLPLIGTLRASGATAPALEQNVTAALEAGYIKAPRVNVEITLYRPFYIIGAVNRPGQYPYVDHMSALNAVALAGGFTDQAIQSSVYIRHEGSATEQAVETGQLAHIEPGDVVRVRTSPFWEAMNLFSPVAGPAAIAAATWH